MVSQELARIVAHIAGDGYIGKYLQKRSARELSQHPRKNLWRGKWFIRYVNTDPDLVQQFTEDVQTEFKRRVVTRKKHEYEVSGKWIYLRVTELGAGKSRDWFVPEQIAKGKSTIKSSWLQAFFDDEAHVSVPQRRIVLNMVNERGLAQVKSMLETLSIKSTLKGPYRYKQFQSYHLTIYRESLRNYQQSIDFSHKKKKHALAKILEL